MQDPAFVQRLARIRDDLDTASREREQHRAITGNAQRQAHMRAAIAQGTHEQWQWWRLFNFYGRQCCCCGSRARIAKDHIWPVSRGGSDRLDNLQPLCQVCNTRKLAKHEDYRWDHGEWARVMEMGWIVGE